MAVPIPVTMTLPCTGDQRRRQGRLLVMNARAVAMPEADVISSAAAGTLPGLFALRVQRSPDDPAYRQFDPASGNWQSYTWRETGGLVTAWKTAMAGENLDPGERVAVLLRNSLEWVCFDQAALALGLVVVPLYLSDTADNIAYILEDAGARLLLVGTHGRWKTLAPHCANLTGLEKVLCVQRPEEDAPADSSGKIPVEAVDSWLRRPGGHGRGEPDAQPHHYELDKSRNADPNQLATLVYTSGTTGKPKGVMLSHHNILWNTEAILTAVSGYRDDVYLSLLPLSHMFERTAGYYLPMMAGSSVAYARSLKDLKEDLATIRPRILIGVPQMFDGVQAKARQQVQEKGRLAGLLFDWTLTIGWQQFIATQHRPQKTSLPLWHRLAWPLLRRLVADKMLESLGGRLRIAVSGGGPLGGEVSRYFLALGLPLVQGYGMTEAAPVLTVNRLDDNIPESAGPPLPGVEVRLGDEDELLARSPGVMLGYWHRPEDTRVRIDPEGWLHTGDQARIAEGHVFICGRLKEILVTSSGEKVPPADLEAAILQDALISQAMVVGEGRPHLGAILVLNPGEWEKVAVSLGLHAADPAALASSVVKNYVINRIKAAVRGFPKYARVRAVYLTLEPWSVENGLLTPTLKLKRPEVKKRFADEITRLYGEQAAQ
ncbi:AMP-dependent synthetase/ligase [Nitrosospira sp. Is2]|uniref:AMP-dependent synthetase/ligase n=1 Tax=Nitrosospira sp. Is2 TaxID=3080532 RepID=UPI0029539772|nr:AMP-dependent synthetase/ligase [Nitrosospira sp. Is2]WON73706.1 AMP-dependent synthetase/ligase [Nitrosospira sp. Is2]